MSYSDFHHHREHTPYEDGGALLKALWELYDAGLVPPFQQLLRENASLVRHNFCVWLIFPMELQEDQIGQHRYTDMVMKMARFFMDQGDSEPMLLFMGQVDNPMQSWDTGLQEAEQHMKRFDFEEANATLGNVLQHISQFQGPGTEIRRPFVHERLSWLNFLREDTESAELHAQAALQGFQQLGRLEGELTVTRRLADIARARQDQARFRHWMILHTNGLIQLGHPENAAAIRRLNGIEPEEGLIPPP